jgi:hypothetical protein
MGKAVVMFVLEKECMKGSREGSVDGKSVFWRAEGQVVM